jgi:hypothetical protein
MAKLPPARSGKPIPARRVKLIQSVAPWEIADADDENPDDDKPDDPRERRTLLRLLCSYRVLLKAGPAGDRLPEHKEVELPAKILEELGFTTPQKEAIRRATRAYRSEKPENPPQKPKSL